MAHIEIRSRVGPDGVLAFSVPIGISEANREVKITIESAEPHSERPLISADQWRKFIDETAGSITDPTFKRHE